MSGFLLRWATAVAAWVALNVAAEVPASSEQAQWFERKIRPLLVDRCYECHGPEKQKGGLRLDSMEAVLKGGESGTAIVPGQPDQSRLIEAVRYTNPDFQMPPKQKLNARQVADLEEWIRIGAPWPASGPRPAEPNRTDIAAHASPNDKSWWAFQPIRKPELPKLQAGSTSPRIPIDAFVLAELERRHLAPNPRAGRRELIRRVYFDLIGLPPTYEQVQAFEQDKRPDAFERVVDHLLAQPQYGERWGRHWLDVVRFAQSTGYERDAEKPLAWRYRDYVIQSFNDDKPYNQFVIEQLAGDELPEFSKDALIATGFYRLGVWDDEPADKQLAEYDEFDDYVSTTGAAFLGLTLGCARCHDHKFDPIPQADYYSLLAFFRNIRGYESPKMALDSAAFVPLAPPPDVRRWEAENAEKLRPLEAAAAASKLAHKDARAALELCQSELDAWRAEPGEISERSGWEMAFAFVQHELRVARAARESAERSEKAAQEALEKQRAAAPPWEWALAIKEHSNPPPPTHLLIRGNPLSRGPEVKPAFLSAFHADAAPVLGATNMVAGTGRRLQLARWIASDANPLTARVLVNRVWKHHFGHGLVKTTTDFGRAGALPTHPALLDWLATEFMANGWSIKKLHRSILLSEAYQRSSRAVNAAALAADPGNDLLWRQSLRRLEAEAIRDTVLNVSGKLNLTPAGRGFFPRLAGEVIAGASRPGLDWEIPSEEEASRRSVYIFVKRTMLAPALQSFDYSTTDSPLGERPTTTVASQALHLLNDAFLLRQASAFADRLEREAGSIPSDQIRRAYQLAVSRDPSEAEQRLALDLLKRQEKSFGALGHRVTFRPDVPESIYGQYQEKLRPSDHLAGPAEGWSYHRGDWTRDYEGIRTVERVRGPFALRESEAFEDGTIEATLVLNRASEFASLLVRSRARGTIQRGYEVALDARQQEIALRRHGASTVTIASESAVIPAAAPVRVRVEMAGNRFRVWLENSSEPVLDVTDSEPLLEPGLVGVRVWGAPMNMDALSVATANGKQDLLARGNAEVPPQRRALEALCLTLLNLNEVIYVD